MPEVYDTIVVGLGAAGVTALSTLARSGRKVLGLEADSRVGGRVKTVEFGDGVVELGAEWIHGTEDSRVYEMAIGHNVPIKSQDMTFKAFRSDGTEVDKVLVNNLIDFCLSSAEKLPKEPQPLGDYVTKRLRNYISSEYPELLKDEDFVNQFIEFMSLLVNNYEASDDWNDVTTGSMYKELGGDQHMSWGRQGYKTLFELLLKTYKNGPGLPSATIMLNKTVSSIKWPRDSTQSRPVEVVCEDGSCYLADSVIVTVSLGVLKARYKSLFTPQLPTDKCEAIEMMSIGVMDKIILSFDEQWWPRDATWYGFIWKAIHLSSVAPPDRWLTRVLGASRGEGSRNTVTLWTSGSTGIIAETLPEDVVKRKSVELLRIFMGKHVPEPTGIIRSVWHSNPLTLGSYSHDGVSNPDNPRSRAALATPLTDARNRIKVLFAGEATNAIHFSTVHGAMETGIRAADMLLVNSKI